MLGIVFAIFVAIFWSVGELTYSNASKKYDRTNIYMYTYLLRAIIYVLVVFIFRRSLFGTFDMKVFSSTLPIIFCDLFASLVINIAVYNGKLSVVSPIMAAYPVLDVLLGVVLLRENASILEIVMVIAICLAIIYLAVNQKSTNRAPHPIKGIIFSIIYMFLVALSTYFEKSIYIKSFTVYDLYYYKGMIYGMASLFFALVIFMTPTKMKKPSLDILKGCGFTPIGNVLYSFALSFGSMTIVAPISSLYSVLTNFLSRIYLREKINLKEKISIYLILILTILLVILKI